MPSSDKNIVPPCALSISVLGEVGDKQLIGCEAKRSQLRGARSWDFTPKSVVMSCERGMDIVRARLWSQANL
jgi:hypothetical protein